MTFTSLTDTFAVPARADLTLEVTKLSLLRVPSPDEGMTPSSLMTSRTLATPRATCSARCLSCSVCTSPVSSTRPAQLVTLTCEEPLTAS